MANTQQPLTSDGGFTTAANVSVSGNISVAGNIIGGAGSLIWGNNITIGSAAGNTSADATAYNVAIGVLAGNTMGNGSIAIGYAAGRNNRGIDTVIIGDGAGASIYTATQVGNVGLNANVLSLPATVSSRWLRGMALSDPGASIPAGVAISNAGQTLGNTTFFSVTNASSFYSVATLIGTVTNLGNGAIAIGNVAGNASQGVGAISIGDRSGQAGQGNRSIAIGELAGNTTQGSNAIAIGASAGLSAQGSNAIAIGAGTGSSQSGNAIAIGINAGQRQGFNAVAIGYNTAGNGQGNNSVAINSFAANQGTTAIAILGGGSNQGNSAISFNSGAGAFAPQGEFAISMGVASGGSQSAYGIAIGVSAAGLVQNANGIAIGTNAGYSQGQFSIAIGANAGYGSQPQANNSIVLNASGANLLGNIANAFIVRPVRNDSANLALPLYYNSATGEITFNNAANGGGFGNSISIGFNATAPNIGIYIGPFSGNSYTANVTNASSSGNIVSTTGSVANLFPGLTAAGSAGIPAGTRIIGVNYAQNVITLSGNVTFSANNFTFFGNNVPGNNSIGIGVTAGNIANTGDNSISFGYATRAGGDNSIVIGSSSQSYSAGGNSVAIGQLISSLGANSIGIGQTIRFNVNGFVPNDSIYMGTNSGNPNNIYNQQIGNIIALGTRTGNTAGNNSISIGMNSGNNFGSGGNWGNSDSTIAIGVSAAANVQYRHSIAIGTQAGSNTQGFNFNGPGASGHAMAIGFQAGQNSQNSHAMAIGFQAGQSTQGSNAIAIGYQAGISAATTTISNAAISGSSLSLGINSAISGPPPQVGMLITGAGVTFPSYITAVVTEGSIFQLSAISPATGQISMTGTIGQGQQTVAVGVAAGAVAQGHRSVAVGHTAGTTVQGTNSVAIGALAGQYVQGSNAVAIGAGAGANSQGFGAVAIGGGAGRSGAVVVNSNAAISGNVVSLFGTTTGGSFTVGQQVVATLGTVPAGTIITATGFNNVTISFSVANAQTGLTFSAVGGQSANAVAIGQGAGTNLQGREAIAIGYSAAGNNQAGNSIAIGSYAGAANQGANSVAVGPFSASSQGSQSVALGYLAGAVQNANATALGTRAGQNTQGIGAVAVGFQAGTSAQGNTALAVGFQAATQSQAGNAVALGTNSGQFTQGANAVALGTQAGFISQQGNTVALGLQTAQYFQGNNAIAIGSRAGQAGALATNSNARVTGSSANVSLFGTTTGTFAVGQYLPPSSLFVNNTFIISVVGNVLVLNQFAQSTSTSTTITAYGNVGQGANAVAIGTNAGQLGQGANSIAIGTDAGASNQPINSIILNATGTEFPNVATQADAFYVAPIRNDTSNTFNSLFYNLDTNEITYAPVAAAALANGTSNVSIPVTNGNVLVSVSGVGNTVTFTTSGIVIASAEGNVLSTTGDVSVGNVSATNLFGNIVTSAQPNITSLGELTNLSVAGNVSVTGNTVLNNANILGTVSIASATGTSLTVAGNALVTGNLTVQGNLISVNTNNLNVANAIIGIGRLANNQPLTNNDGMDRGEQLWYYNTEEDSAFIGWQNSSGNILLASNVDIANNIVTVNNYGTTQAGNLLTAGYISSVGNVTAGNISALGNVTAAYFIGNIGNATGLNRITNGTSNVVIAANSNVTIGVNGANVIDVGTGIISVAGSVNTTSLLTNKQVVSNTLSNIGTTLYNASNNAIGGAKFKIYAQGFGSTASVQMAEVLLTRDGTNNTSNVATTVYALINTNTAVANVSFAGTLNANRLSLTYNSGGGTYYYTYSVTEFVRT